MGPRFPLLALPVGDRSSRSAVPCHEAAQPLNESGLLLLVCPVMLSCSPPRPCSLRGSAWGLLKLIDLGLLASLLPALFSLPRQIGRTSGSRWPGCG